MISTFPAVLEGLQTTLLLGGALVVLCYGVGIPVGALETSKVWPLRFPSRILVEIFRGIPVIVSLFFVYFLLPVIGMGLGSFMAALVGIGLWGMANVAEITRGAISSISLDQWRSAQALGFTQRKALMFVVIPLAIRRAIPPQVSFLANLIQATSLAAVIGVSDILESANRGIERAQLISGEAVVIPTYMMVFAFFFLISFPLTHGSRRLERHLET